jgi:hypothetical protein
MGIQYSYKCTAAKVTEKLGVYDDDYQLLRCELQFEDEHGNQLAPVSNAVVVANIGGGNTILQSFLRNPEDVLPDMASHTDWEKVQALCDTNDNPTYDFYEQVEVVARIGDWFTIG